MYKKPFLRQKRGQSLIEYVALTALVAIVSIGTVKTFGGKIRSRLNQITNAFDKNIQQGLKRSHETGGEKDEEDNQIHLPGGISIPKNFPLLGGLE